VLSFGFLEVNLRTYVHLDGRVHGIWFFSLDASSSLAVLGGRLLGTPYRRARIERQSEAQGGSWRILRENGATALAADYGRGAPIGSASRGSLEHFLHERYVMFVRRAGLLWSGRIHHEPYQLEAASAVVTANTLPREAGIPLGDPCRPDLVTWSHGVDLELFPAYPSALATPAPSAPDCVPAGA
jgi:uncharacterized protein YqjF (DUF2071 family)